MGSLPREDDNDSRCIGPTNQGFTLIELQAVIAIIDILKAMLLSSLLRANCDRGKALEAG